MPLTKLQSEGLNLADNFAFTGTVSGAGGGITEIDQWRLSANFTTTTGTLDSNWERVDTYGYDKLGTGLSQSSGIFSFPSTGHYLIMFNAYFDDTYAGNYIGVQMYYTQNNSSYNTVESNYTNSPTNGHHANVQIIHHLDITDTSNQKFKFQGNSHDSSRFSGSTSTNNTNLVSIRLADT